MAIDQIMNTSVSINQPKVGIIITHYNYGSFVEKAINSALAQNYENFELIVVDDSSNQDNKRQLSQVVESAQGRVKVVWSEKNQGQIEAFFAGVKEIDADFYCLLDPDDQYLPTFIEEMVAAHLNDYIYVSMVCCNQKYTVNGRQVSGTNLSRNIEKFKVKTIEHYDAKFLNWQAGRWPWTSTSSMMFRKDALRMLKTLHKTDIKICADTYLATGCRYMGGTLLYEKPLVFRSVHDKNAYHNDYIISSKASQGGDNKKIQKQLKELAFLNFIENGGSNLFGKKHCKKLARNEFNAQSLRWMLKQSPKLKEIITYTDMLLTVVRGIRRKYKSSKRHNRKSTFAR